MSPPTRSEPRELAAGALKIQVSSKLPRKLSYPSQHKIQSPCNGLRGPAGSASATSPIPRSATLLTAATLASLLFLEHTYYAPVSGPLHRLLPLPAMLFPLPDLCPRDTFSMGPSPVTPFKNESPILTLFSCATFYHVTYVHFFIVWLSSPGVSMTRAGLSSLLYPKYKSAWHVRGRDSVRNR